MRRIGKKDRKARVSAKRMALIVLLSGASLGLQGCALLGALGGIFGAVAPMLGSVAGVAAKAAPVVGQVAGAAAQIAPPIIQAATAGGGGGGAPANQGGFQPAATLPAMNAGGLAPNLGRGTPAAGGPAPTATLPTAPRNPTPVPAIQNTGRDINSMQVNNGPTSPASIRNAASPLDIGGASPGIMNA